MRARRAARGYAALALAVLGLGVATSPVRAARVDPVGVWSCVIYGHPAFGDERVLLHLEAAGRASLARVGDEDVRGWVPLSAWNLRRGALEFADFRTGRAFRADLDRDEEAARLGGTWTTETLVGGWWCGRADVEITTTIDGRAVPESMGLMPPLVPVRMSMPAYPRNAVREAKEGRVVACFTVTSDGRVAEPEIVEISDEIFRSPTLRALGDSSYRGWDDARVRRPACRSFIYLLDE